MKKVHPLFEFASHVCHKLVRAGSSDMAGLRASYEAQKRIYFPHLRGGKDSMNIDGCCIIEDQSLPGGRYITEDMPEEIHPDYR